VKEDCWQSPQFLNIRLLEYTLPCRTGDTGSKLPVRATGEFLRRRADVNTCWGRSRAGQDSCCAGAICEERPVCGPSHCGECAHSTRTNFYASCFDRQGCKTVCKSFSFESKSTLIPATEVFNRRYCVQKTGHQCCVSCSTCVPKQGHQRPLSICSLVLCRELVYRASVSPAL